MNSVQDVWEKILEILSEQLTSITINTWFSDCVPIDLDQGTLVLQAQNAFKRDLIQNRYAAGVKAAMKDLFSADFDLVLLTPDETADYMSAKQEKNSLPEMDGYTFDNFIVGTSNKFAHAAALGVVKNPGSLDYNPLFIYGNSGLGKTHLLRAIGSAIHMNNPNAKIILVKGEDFLNELLHSIRDGRSEEFREKYRSADLFLMDDIQFIAGKETTQLEFFNTFESIYNAKHQIVLTSDRPPKDMATLDDRLRTRFEGGLMADIQAPDKELRIAIIRDKAGHMALYLSDEIVEHIADQITNNIRQIEGVLKKLSAYSGIGEPITKELVEKSITDVKKDGDYIPTPDDIIRETARYFAVSEEDIKGLSRQKNIASARHISAYLIRVLTNYPLQTIGNFLNRDHATINASVKKIERDMRESREVANTIRDITSNINSRNR